MITGDFFYLRESSTVFDVIDNINANELQVCFIVDVNKHLLGSITDGDIRRGLISGHTLESKASSIMNRTPVSISVNKPIYEAKLLMQKSEVKHLPAVDSNNVLCGVHIWDEVNVVKEIENTMLIMAGGFGKRMLPLTEKKPKPMLEVSGKPILEHIILNAKSQGFKNFILSVYYLSESIIDYFGDGSSLNVNIDYIKEDEPLGTAGALSLINLSSDLSFVVTNGDIITDVNYVSLLDFHDLNNSDATMAIKKYELQNPFGVVKTNGLEIDAFEEKPIQVSYVNAGIYAIKPKNLKYLKKNKYCDMPNFFMSLKEKNCLITAYPIHETWSDLGKPKDLSKANKK